jgi:hypothetical protein
MTNSDVVVVGFDAAWTDHPRKPGAICATHYRGGACVRFEPPRLVSFAEGLSFIVTFERPDGRYWLRWTSPPSSRMRQDPGRSIRSLDR